MLAQVPVATDVFSGQGLFKPCQIKSVKGFGAAYHFCAVKALVGIGHDFKTGPYSIAHGRQTGHIFADVRPANFDFGAFEAISFCFEGLLDQHLG